MYGVARNYFAKVCISMCGSNDSTLSYVFRSKVVFNTVQSTYSQLSYLLICHSSEKRKPYVTYVFFYVEFNGEVTINY